MEKLLAHISIMRTVFSQQRVLSLLMASFMEQRASVPYFDLKYSSWGRQDLKLPAGREKVAE